MDFLRRLFESRLPIEHPTRILMISEIPTGATIQPYTDQEKIVIGAHVLDEYKKFIGDINPTDAARIFVDPDWITRDGYKIDQQFLKNSFYWKELAAISGLRSALKE